MVKLEIEICFSESCSHFGHSVISTVSTIFCSSINSCPQFLHLYSYIAIHSPFKIDRKANSYAIAGKFPHQPLRRLAKSSDFSGLFKLAPVTPCVVWDPCVVHFPLGCQFKNGVTGRNRTDLHWGHIPAAYHYASGHSTTYSKSNM